MRLKNSETHFGFGSIFLHWLIAIIIFGMLILGLYMTSLPLGVEKLQLYGWHKETGFVVLGLVILRILWRNLNISPRLALPIWEWLAARATHLCLYILMLAMPITGWLLSSAAGFPVSFFGLFTIPMIIPANDANRLLFQSIHHWLAYVLIALICLHVLAAFKHHFYDKDDILRRMIS